MVSVRGHMGLTRKTLRRNRGRHRSLDAELKADGWCVESFIPSERDAFAYGLSELVRHAQFGYFDKVKILPSEVARDGETFVPDHEDSHIVYVRRTGLHANLVREREGNTSVKVRCRNVNNGEITSFYDIS